MWKCPVEFLTLYRFNRMSSVSPVIPPKKKKRTKSKKEGQEDNMASNMNTTMTGPALLLAYFNIQ